MRRRMGVAVTLAMRKGGGEFVFVDLTNRSNGKDNNDDGVCHAPDTKRWNAHRADPFWYSVFLFVVKAVASVAPPQDTGAPRQHKINHTVELHRASVLEVFLTFCLTSTGPLSLYGEGEGQMNPLAICMTHQPQRRFSKDPLVFDWSE